MLLIDTQERETAAEQADRLYRAQRRRQRLRDAGLFTGILAIVAGILLAVLLAPRGPLGGGGEDSDHEATATEGSTAVAAAPTAAEAKGVKFEKFERVDPALPAIPPGAVKRFKVDVYEHVTKVSDDLAPTEVWSYAINGVEHRGTGVSEPMVVEVGDRVKIDLVNGSSERMNVRMPHSIDYHSSEVNPGEAFKTIPPGGRHSFEFTAKHPGVFMYHCATDPVLHHTGAGMVGAMIVKPKDLAPVDRELWINQQEFYIGKPGGVADMEKMQAKQPDVIAFNGYAGQYKKEPIAVKKGERIRMFVLNSGPSIWSAFHVIGTVFDTTMIEGVEGHHAQTVNLAPSQGGWVEFTLDEEGTYPFVTHAFGDMVKGSVGVLATENAPHAGMKH
jgi:nitrite reductase (NO-forming)